MEANHQALQEMFDKIEKDLKEEISQAQRNIVGQIAFMLGLPYPRSRKSLEEGISVEDSPFLPEKANYDTKGHSDANNSQAMV